MVDVNQKMDEVPTCEDCGGDLSVYSDYACTCSHNPKSIRFYEWGWEEVE